MTKSYFALIATSAPNFVSSALARPRSVATLAERTSVAYEALADNPTFLVLSLPALAPATANCALRPLKSYSGVFAYAVIVVPAGALVEGKVTKCTSSGLFGRAGKLEFTINSVRSINGVDIPLQYTDFKEAGSDDGAVAVAAVVTLIGGLFMKGKNVSFPAGTKMSAKVVADTDLNVRLDNLAEMMNPAKPQGVVIQINQ